MDILDYADRVLRYPLFPVQRFILKLFYQLQLEDTQQTIEIQPPWSPAVLKFTEVEYYKRLLAEKRTNAEALLPSGGFWCHDPYNGLYLKAGQRGGKTHLAQLIQMYELNNAIEHRVDASIQALTVFTHSTEEATYQRGELLKLLEQDVFIKRSLASKDRAVLYFYDRGAGRDDSPSILFRYMWKRDSVYLGYYMPFLQALDVMPQDLEYFQKAINHQRLSSANRPFRFIAAPGILGTIELDDGDSKSRNMFLDLPSWEINPTLDRDVIRDEFAKNAALAARTFGNPLALL